MVLTLVAIKINEIKQTQALTATDETKDTSHLVNANKKLKTPLTSKDMSHLGKLYMTLFERLEPQSDPEQWPRPSGEQTHQRAWRAFAAKTYMRTREYNGTKTTKTEQKTLAYQILCQPTQVIAETTTCSCLYSHCTLFLFFLSFFFHK